MRAVVSEDITTQRGSYLPSASDNPCHSLPSNLSAFQPTLIFIAT